MDLQELWSSLGAVYLAEGGSWAAQGKGQVVVGTRGASVLIYCRESTGKVLLNDEITPQSKLTIAKGSWAQWISNNKGYGVSCKDAVKMEAAILQGFEKVSSAPKPTSATAPRKPLPQTTATVSQPTPATTHSHSTPPSQQPPAPRKPLPQHSTSQNYQLQSNDLTVTDPSPKPKKSPIVFEGPRKAITVPPGKAIPDKRTSPTAMSQIPPPLKSLPSTSSLYSLLQPDDKRRIAYALFSYTSRSERELGFEKGDILVVNSTENGQWWNGALLNDGVEGPAAYFPSQYVKMQPRAVQITPPQPIKSVAVPPPIVASKNDTKEVEPKSKPPVKSVEDRELDSDVQTEKEDVKEDTKKHARFTEKEESESESSDSDVDADYGTSLSNRPAENPEIGEDGVEGRTTAAETREKTGKVAFKEGWLVKRGRKKIDKWRDRYFVLTGPNLTYFRNKDLTKKPLGKIDMMTATVMPLEGQSTRDKWFFDIVTPNREYHLMTYTYKIMDQWINVIQDSTENYFKNIQNKS